MNYNIENFKKRECKAKDIFEIREIDKPTAYEFVRKYHYLGDAKFFSQKAFGLYLKNNDQLVGVSTFAQPQGISALKGWFSLENQNKDILELSRLAMLPILNGTNATSYLLGGSIKELKKQKCCRAVITLACSERHVGSIYQVCNFDYYGLSDKKTDFYSEDGKINPRGKTNDVYGVWLPRARKHRYAYIIDKTLKVNYEKQTKPKVNDTIELDCCNGTNRVYDKRFNRYYTCPRCTGKLERIFMEEKDVKKKNEIRVIEFDTDKMIDVSKLLDKEPDLFDELMEDYPIEKGTRLIFNVN